MSDDDYISLVRDASRPLEPQPTGVAAQLPALPAVKAVMFDIYGTLLISASGDIGLADPLLRSAAVVEALASVGLEIQGDPGSGAAELRRQIETSHAASREQGVEFPEVEIRDVWRATCQSLCERGAIHHLPTSVDFQRLAIEFEIRTNPVWPMPGLVDCLDQLRRRGRVLGVISNAQFFTPLALSATTNLTVDQLGFDPALRYYSYEHRRAKPGAWLYQQAARGLQERGIVASEVLYVGNDMRNDVWPAAAVGFQTALFAGDRRSLRLREGDAKQDTGHPDAVVTTLDQVRELIATGPA